MAFSIGDIMKSKVWLSVEWHKYRLGYGWAWPYVGKTYCGTKTGIVLSLGRLVIIGHIR